MTMDTPIHTKSQAIKQFIRENWKIMTEDPFPSDLYNEKKKEFFSIIHDNVFGRPRDREICNELVEFLIRNNIIEDNAKFEKVCTLGFVAKNLSNDKKRLFIQKISKDRKPTVIIDPKKMKDALIQEEYKDKLLEEVIRDRSEDIDAEIQRKTDKLLSIPASLDGEIFSEPELDPSNDEVDLVSDLWWRQLGLIADPFPGEGLESIDKRFFDQIVLKTSIFETHLKYIENEGEGLFKNTIVFGEFGSGKTTLFEYISHKLILNHFVPLYIVLHREKNLEGMIARFKHTLLKEIKEVCLTNSLHYQFDDDFGIDEKIEYLFSLVNTVKKGFVIFIDDLHKTKNINAAMEFLSYIQSYSSDIRRRKSKINFAVYVAGYTDWKSELKQPRYSGSFSRFREMPQISPHIAHEAINMRLAAFSANTLKPRQISYDVIERAHKEILRKEDPLVFRSYIQLIQNEFEKYNWDILVYNAIVSEDQKNHIKQSIEANYTLNLKFNNLIYGSESVPGIQSIDNVEKCLKELIRTYLKRKIFESDDIFVENKFYYQRLYLSGLLSKVNSNKGVYYIVDEDLITFNDEIYENIGLSLDDYLLNIYLEKDVIQTQSLDNYEDILSDIQNKIDGTIYRNLTQSIKIMKDVSNVFDDIIESSILHDLGERYKYRNKMVESFELITKSICRYENMDVSRHKKFWDGFCYDSDNIISHISILNDNNIFDNSVNDINAIKYFYRSYKSAFDDAFNYLRKEIDLQHLFPIPYKKLNHEQIQHMYLARTHFSETRYFECASITNEIMQKTLREFINNTFSLFYGYNYYGRLDKKLRGYINRNISKDKRKEFNISNNPIDYVNRNDYKSIVYEGTSGKQNWNEIFTHVFNPYNLVDLETFLNKLADIALITEHLKSKSINRNQINVIYGFMLDSIKYMEKMNQFYLDVMRNIHIDKTDESNDYYFSLNELKDKNKLEKIVLDSELATRIFLRIKSEREIEDIPLYEPEYVMNYFECDYRQFYAFVSIFRLRTNEELKKLNFNGRISLHNNHFGGTKVNIEYREI